MSGFSRPRAYRRVRDDDGSPESTRNRCSHRVVACHAPAGVHRVVTDRDPVDHDIKYSKNQEK